MEGIHGFNQRISIEIPGELGLLIPTRLPWAAEASKGEVHDHRENETKTRSAGGRRVGVFELLCR